MGAYAFEEFDIDNAISPTVTRKSVKLMGVGKAVSVLSSPSRSTEEMIAGAVSALGGANRNVMFVHSSLNALDDRLRTAGKIAQAVNTAKQHGTEGFTDVKYLNPWEYAIESKAGDFFKKIWQAIRSACRRVIEAIAYIIKWIGNAIAGADVKAQVKDYDYFTRNKARIDKYAKAAGVPSAEFNSLEWKVDASGLAKVIKKAAGTYASVTRANVDDVQAIQNLSRADFKTMKDPADVAKAYGKIFGLPISTAGFGDKAYYKHAADKVKKMTDAINADIESGLKAVFGNTATGKIDLRALVLGQVAKSDKVGKISCGNMRKLSGDFSVLSDAWLSNNVKSVIATVSAQQKVFTSYTKTIDDVAKKFDSVSTYADGVSALSKLSSGLANARVRYNSIWSRLMLELESVALRYRKSAHLALKQYIRAATGKAAAEKSGESLSDNQLESLFQFE